MFAFCAELQSFGALTSAEASEAISHLVETLALVDVGYLRRHYAPALYRSGVYYCRDKNGKERQWWDIPTIRQNGCADCKGLAAWRIAELRVQGIMAHPYVSTKNGQLFHVQVRVGNQIEDPSEILGMHT